MLPLEIAGQAVSIVAMACNILSYQQKKQRNLVFCQLLGGALFAISYFLLGEPIGGLLNILATTRAVLFLFEKKTHASHPAWLCGFITCYIASYVLNFTVFGTEPSAIRFVIEILPVIGMTALSVAFMLGNSRMTRRLSLISSPAWLIYNIYCTSIGAIICEVISLASILIGMYRHDRKHQKTEENTKNIS